MQWSSPSTDEPQGRSWNTCCRDTESAGALLWPGIGWTISSAWLAATALRESDAQRVQRIFASPPSYRPGQSRRSWASSQSGAARVNRLGNKALDRAGACAQGHLTQGRIICCVIPNKLPGPRQPQGCVAPRTTELMAPRCTARCRWQCATRTSAGTWSLFGCEFHTSLACMSGALNSSIFNAAPRLVMTRWRSASWARN